MKKFSIQVTETCKAWFVVEAETEEMANEILLNHEEDIGYALSKNCEGWEFSTVEAEPDEEPDYSAEEEN